MAAILDLITFYHQSEYGNGFPHVWKHRKACSIQVFTMFSKKDMDINEF